MARKRGRASLLKAQTGTLLTEFVESLERSERGRPSRPRAGEELDGGERLRIVDTLIRVLEGAYCHLLQKRAAYANDPIQALQLLRVRAAALSNTEFHLALTTIVTGLRDAHTLYTGPASLQGAVATLPFLVEQYGPYEKPTFVVSKVSAPKLIGDAQFVEGVELTHWNGVPFARAVDLYADWETGGRPDARRARALETLTSRALDYGPPPDEMWVDIRYRTPGKKGAPKKSAPRDVRIPWRTVLPDVSPERPSAGPTRGSHHRAVDLAAEQVRRAKKLMFSGELWDAERSGRAVPRDKGWIATRMQDALAARKVKTRTNGELGYLRIWSFDVDDDDAFVLEVARLLEHLPERGLIIDIRGNPGGLIWAAERTLQLLTPRTITPTRFSLLATPLTRAMARSPFNRLEFGSWLPSLEAAIATGEPYSQPLPLTDPEWCNDVGQRYSGPVVCVVDPNTYSSGDIFAAGFVDNEIGPLVSVGEGTGAGGANVWTHDDLREALSSTPFALQALPGKVGYTMAIRRTVRSCAADGVPIEDLGVSGIPYAMTENDLLHRNEDLIDFCGRLLKSDGLTSMGVKVGKASLTMTTYGLTQLETYVDGCPAEAVRAIKDGACQLPRPSGKAKAIEFVGRARGRVCQRRRVQL